MTKLEIVKALWCSLKREPPPRNSDAGVLIWREQPDWANGWGMRGWARYYPTFAQFITFKKMTRASISKLHKDESHYASHWMTLPIPTNQLWTNANLRQPPITKNNGYVLYNPFSKCVTVSTGVSAQNIIYYSYVTKRNCITHWMPLVGPYDTIAI